MDVLVQIKKEAKRYFENAKGSHDWEHTERVYNLCIHIGKEEKADIEILKLAAILHDIGREYQDKTNGRVCHAEKGALLARELLGKHAMDKVRIDKVIHCIECHRFRGDRIPQSKEAKVLYDADKLDSIGAVGIGRAFLFAGEVGAQLHNIDVDVEKTEPYTKEDTAYREFMVKLKKVKDKMLTEEGKRIAEERHAFMEEFFDRLNKEVEGNL
ncbi:MAG: HD domain-containing protein [Deltaproteobacteria bacterium]|nr:HD domain-containing protein [Deltaproteobacteria bacterium]